MHRRPIIISAPSDELNEPKFLLLLLARPFSFFYILFRFYSLPTIFSTAFRLATATVNGKIKHFLNPVKVVLMTQVTKFFMKVCKDRNSWHLSPISKILLY